MHASNQFNHYLSHYLSLLQFRGHLAFRDPRMRSDSVHGKRCWACYANGCCDVAQLNAQGLTLVTCMSCLQTPEQQQHVKALQYLVQRPLEAAHNAAMLTALTASYRDLYVIMDQMHKKDILGIPRPLLDEPPAPSSSSLGQQQQEAEQPPAINHTQMFYPVRDFTKLPDAPVPYGGWLRNHLKHRYMSK